MNRRHFALEGGIKFIFREVQANIYGISQQFLLSIVTSSHIDNCEFPPNSPFSLVTRHSSLVTRHSPLSSLIILIILITLITHLPLSQLVPRHPSSLVIHIIVASIFTEIESSSRSPRVSLHFSCVPSRIILQTVWYSTSVERCFKFNTQSL